MRILHSIRSVNPAGGGPIEGVKQLAHFHSISNISVEVVCLDAPDDPWVKEFPLKIHPMGPAKSKYGYSPHFTSWLKAHFHEYDAIIINGLWQYNGFGVWRVVHKTSIPYFVFTHGMLDPWFKQTYPLKHLKKWLYWPWGEYRVLRDARAVFFTCEEERRLARKSFWLYRCREKVLGYGTKMPTGDPSKERSLFFEKYPHLQGKPIWLFLSRLHEKKGLDLLLKAFAKVSKQSADVHLVIAGPDQNGYQSYLEQMAVNLDIQQRVTWPGMLQGEIKWGAFRAADVFILPSHQENFGIAVAEALACGVPVLISNKVNIWHEIEIDQAGFVESDDLAGTIALMERWLNTDQDRRKIMSQNALTCFRTRFEMSQVAERFIGAIKN